ncbi:MAG: bacterial Ig-like domain-containing protein [Treponema sp.]|nr:bacterial Ig-like domain-containing protein [Treponema sp.]
MKKLNLIKAACASVALALVVPGCSGIGESPAQTEATVENGKVAVSISVDTSFRTIISDISSKSYTYGLTVTNTALATDTKNVTIADITTPTVVRLTDGGTYRFVLTAYDGTSPALSGSKEQAISASNANVSLSLSAVTGESVDVTLALTVSGAAGYGMSAITATVYTDSTLSTKSPSEADDLSVEVGENGAFITNDDGNYILSGTIGSGESKWLKIDVTDSDGTVIGSTTESIYAINKAALKDTVIVPITQYKATVSVKTATKPSAVTLKNTNVSTAEAIALSTTSASSPYTYTGYVPAGTYSVLIDGTSYASLNNANVVTVDPSLTFTGITAKWSGDAQPTFYADTVTDEAIIAALIVTASYEDGAGNAAPSQTVTSGITLTYDKEKTTEQDLTVTYNEKTATVKLTLAGLSGISVEPETLAIAFGTEVSTDSLTVTAVYSEGDGKEISATAYDIAYYSDKACETEVDITKATHGTYYAKVSYKEKSAVITLTVTTAPKSLELSASAVVGTASLVSVTGTVSYTDGTTASVENSALSFKNGDTEVTKDSTLSAGSYTLTVTYTGTASADGTVIAGAVTVDVQLAVQTSVPYTANGTIEKDTNVLPLAVNGETGVSVSFWLGSDLTSDWQNVFNSEQVVQNLSTLQYFPNGTWLADIYEGSATIGTDFSSYTADDAWTIFLNEAAYVTVSYNTDGTVVFYKNGKKALTYAATTAIGTAKVSDYCAAFISDVATKGLTLNATDDNGNATLTNVSISSAKDDTAATTAYNTAVATINSIALDTTNVKSEYINGESLSADGLVITATDTNGNTFEVPVSLVSYSGYSMTTAGEQTVTVTVNGKTASYKITVSSPVESIVVTTQPTITSYTLVNAAEADFDTTGLVVKADSSEGSVIDNDLLTFSKITATGGSSQTITITYAEDITTTVTVNVNVVEYNATIGTNESDWWTVWTDADSETDGIQSWDLPAKSSAVIRFVVTDTLAEENWDNWVLVLTNKVTIGADGYAEYSAMRSDNYGWGTGYVAGSNDMQGDDWGTWLTNQKGATVTISIANHGDGTVDVFATTVTADKSKTYTQTYNDQAVTADAVGFFLALENCTLKFGTGVSDVGATVTVSPDVPTADITLESEGNALTVSGTPVTATGAVIAWLVDGAVQSGESNKTFTLTGTKGVTYAVTVEVTVDGITYSKTESVLYQ